MNSLKSNGCPVAGVAPLALPGLWQVSHSPMLSLRLSPCSCRRLWHLSQRAMSTTCLGATAVASVIGKLTPADAVMPTRSIVVTVGVGSVSTIARPSTYATPEPPSNPLGIGVAPAMLYVPSVLCTGGPAGTTGGTG